MKRTSQSQATDTKEVKKEKLRIENESKKQELRKMTLFLPRHYRTTAAKDMAAPLPQEWQRSTTCGPQIFSSLPVFLIHLFC